MVPFRLCGLIRSAVRSGASPLAREAIDDSFGVANPLWPPTHLFEKAKRSARDKPLESLKRVRQV